MNTMGIDIGTTSISIVLIRREDGSLLNRFTVNHESFLPGEPYARIQDPEKIFRLVKKGICEVLKDQKAPASIGLTGQMHGILYIDAQGRAVSPLYTWQDQRAKEPLPDGRNLLELLSPIGPAHPGYGMASHAFMSLSGLVPKEAVSFVTIMDYVGMRLCGLKEGFVSFDLAASLGCFDMEKKAFFLDALSDLGVDASMAPKVLKSHVPIGCAVKAKDLPASLEGASVLCAIGDNQASVLGSLEKPSGSLLVNIGTGSQISLICEGQFSAQGDIEVRPYLEGQSLLAGSSLCGGRSYAILEKFYREVLSLFSPKAGSIPSLYERMEACAREAKEQPRSPALRAVTSFAGTRQDPLSFGALLSMTENNFHPGDLTLAILSGILSELHGYYARMCEMGARPARMLVGSGNAVRKNPLLRELASELFGMPLHVPAWQEEAACGAALLALYASGLVPSFSEVTGLIRYLP